MTLLIIIFFLIFGRFNSSLFGYEFLNTDEFVIGAKASRLINGYNFSEFDGDTSGLLNAVFLIWPNLFNFDITFLSIRLSAIFAISLCLFITYKIINLNVDKRFSILLLSPLILFFSFSKDPDFLHYANESISVLLIILSLFFYLKGNKKEKNLNLFFSSFFLGLVIFAKMQFFPVACLLILLFNLNNIYYKKNFKYFIISSLSFLSPIIILSAYYYLNGELRDLYYNTILYPFSDFFNRNQISSENLIVSSNSLKSVLSSSQKTIFFEHLKYNSLFHLLYLYFAYLLFITFTIFKKSNFKMKNIKFIFLKKELLILTLVIIFTIIIILITGSVHRHYFINLIPLLPIFIVFILKYQIRLKKNEQMMQKYFFVFLVSLFSLSLLLEQKKFYNKNFIKHKFNQNKISFYSPEIFQYLDLEKNKDKAIFWGWRPESYLLSGLIPATRDTINQKQIDYKSDRSYFRERFLKEFEKQNTDLIIDYVKPRGYFFSNNEVSGVQSFFEFNKKIQEDFEKIPNKNENCPDIYLKKDNYKKLKSKLIDYELYNGNKKIYVLNDLNIDEDFCKTNFIFSKNSSKYLKLIFKKEERIKEIKLLSSKKNSQKVQSKIKFYRKGKIIKERKITIEKFPFWTNLIFKKQEAADEILVDLSEFIKHGSGLNEIQIFNN